MGRIINLKSTTEDKVTITLELSESEALWLKGNLDQMHIFSEHNLDFETRLVQRGKGDSTKYILVPKEFRNNIVLSNNVKCNMIETKSSNIFLFAVKKY